MTDRVSAGASIGRRKRQRLGSPVLARLQLVGSPCANDVSLRTSAGFNDRIVRSRNANAFLGNTSRIVSGSARMVSSFSSRAKTVFLSTSCLPNRKTRAGSPVELIVADGVRAVFPDLDRHDRRIELGILDLIRRERTRWSGARRSGSRTRQPRRCRLSPGGAKTAPSLSGFSRAKTCRSRALISICVTAAGSMSATCWLRRATALVGISDRALASTMTTSSWSPWRT